MATFLGGLYSLLTRCLGDTPFSKNALNPRFFFYTLGNKMFTIYCYN